MRFFFAVMMSLAFSWTVYSRAEAEDDPSGSGKGPKYQPYVDGYLLPLFLVIVFLIGRIFLGADYTNQSILSMCFSIFLHISIYYAILLPLLPFLRRRISARACAMLWLTPNYLYLIQQSALSLPVPLLVITAPGKIVWILLRIWFAGFVGVLMWKIAEHFRFRRAFLNQAEICTDPQIRQQWKKALSQAKFKKQDIPLMTSSHITTPVTVGLFETSTVVILPRNLYSQEELELIFQHEIVHIGRRDAWNKFFLVFCTAMCWFNPLMWLAMKRSAEDMELSCDETVLLSADDDTRKKYAELLLNTAGDDRGFSTCLSASAKTLRHRLRSIVKPFARSSGALVVGVTFFILAISNGFVALAYDGAPGSEVIFQSGDHSGYVLTVLNFSEGGSEDALASADGEGILQYLSGLTMYRITGQYRFSFSTRDALFELKKPGAMTYWIYVYDNAIELYPLHEHNPQPVYYYIPDGIDWKHLDTLISD